MKELETALELNRIPEIFYVPEAWTETEQQDWKSMGWRWQMSRICARHGWVSDHIPVLPFRLEIKEEKLWNPRFEALTVAPLLVFFAPTPYVAPIREIERLGKMSRKGRTSRQWVFDIEGNPDGWNKISQWKCQGVADVVGKLDQHYWADLKTKAERVVFYGTLARRLADVKLTADEAEEEV